MMTTGINPYAPPSSGLDAEPPAPLLAVGELASRWQRLGGALFDGLLALMATAPGYIGISLSELGRARKASSNPFLLFTSGGKWGVIAAALLIALTIVQWILLARRGQTVGKMIAGTRVVRLDGSPAGFSRAVALRLWPLEIVSRIPMAQLASLVDVVFIFGERRRCLHDLLAGTKVVRAGS
jgi:uncharacterized RDD family membrane protein YckC